MFGNEAIISMVIWNKTLFECQQKEIYLEIFELKNYCSFLRENGILKPGIHWKSSPLGQTKPWKPKALYNIKMCKQIINKFYSEENYNKAA